MTIVMHTVCHVEIQTVDLDRAEAFYKGLFDWTFKAFMPTMRVFGVGDTHVGGLMLVDKVEAGRSPSIWIQVKSIEETLARVEAFGGKVVSGKSEVPGTGYSADFEDPEGTYIGIVEFA